MSLSVLLLADDCNPQWPSLPIVAYNTVRELSKGRFYGCHVDGVEITLVTHLRNMPNIAARGELKNVHYVDTEIVAGPLHKLSTFIRGGESVGWTTSVAFSYPSYLAFEHTVKKKMGDDIRRGKYDIVHRLTPMSPCIPSLLAKFCWEADVPFVIGPLNGGLAWPKEFENEATREKEWLIKLRQAHKYLPHYANTYKHATAVMAAFDHTVSDLPKNGNVISMPEVGFDPAVFRVDPFKTTPENREVNFMFAGRLVPYKLPALTLECFARSELLRENANLTIVGDGPERSHVNDLARSMRECVQVLGSRSQESVASEMRASDVFVFPSIRELGAGVVVEAMACGSVPLVVDYGGPGSLFSNDAGFKIPMGTHEQLVQRFTNAMEFIVKHKHILPHKSQAARNEAQKYTWENKAKQIVKVYDGALAAHDGWHGDLSKILEKA